MTDGKHGPALKTALAYHQAWTSGDLDGAMAYVADDIFCRAPGKDITGKQSYREFLGGFLQVFTGWKDVGAYGDGEHAVLFYYPYTATTTTAPAAEHFTVRDGQIVESLLVFDRLSYTTGED